jgi:hypothetical protein
VLDQIFPDDFGATKTDSQVDLIRNEIAGVAFADDGQLGTGFQEGNFFIQFGCLLRYEGGLIQFETGFGFFNSFKSAKGNAS